MSERFYLQQMEHFKVKTRFEFLTSKPKQEKLNKAGIIEALSTFTSVDLSSLTAVELNKVLNGFMLGELVEVEIPTGRSKKPYIDAVNTKLGIDADLSKLTIQKLKDILCGL